MESCVAKCHTTRQIATANRISARAEDAALPAFQRRQERAVVGIVLPYLFENLRHSFKFLKKTTRNWHLKAVRYNECAVYAESSMIFAVRWRTADVRGVSW